jgi:hypothetical protein
MKNLITSQDYESALARGRAELEQPHAVDVRFVASSATLRVTFSNGLIVAVDARAVPAFASCPLSVLKNPRVTAGGDGLIFDEAGLAFDLPELLSPFLPIELARSRVAAESGRATSVRKARAARENGAKGGRPRKVALPTA